MKCPVAFPTVNENSEAERNKFKAGVRAYDLDYYDPEYVPSDTDLLRAFRIEPLQCVDMIEASAAVAAESSSGTWTEVWSNRLADIDYYKAKVYRVAKWLRLVGGDHLHTGTVVGKLEGSRHETLGIIDLLRERMTPSDPKRGVYFDQDFAGLKAVWPLASGGIHVLNIPDLYAIYGNVAFWLFGGGTHGHPRGSRAGARANRVATEAIASGNTLDDAAKTRPELREAMELWGKVKFGVAD